tara:strand:+ start:3222 stop:5165 length:1944 start_codon:yes stop_codon:yes gene_type:complete
MYSNSAKGAMAKGAMTLSLLAVPYFAYRFFKKTPSQDLCRFDLSLQSNRELLIRSLEMEYANYYQRSLCTVKSISGLLLSYTLLNQPLRAASASASAASSNKAFYVLIGWHHTYEFFSRIHLEASEVLRQISCILGTNEEFNKVLSPYIANARAVLTLAESKMDAVGVPPGIEWLDQHDHMIIRKQAKRLQYNLNEYFLALFSNHLCESFTIKITEEQFLNEIGQNGMEIAQLTPKLSEMLLTATSVSGTSWINELKGLDLTGFRFSGVDLLEWDLSSTYTLAVGGLPEYQGAILKNCMFTGCNLSKCNFRGVILTGSTFGSGSRLDSGIGYKVATRIAGEVERNIVIKNCDFSTAALGIQPLGHSKYTDFVKTDIQDTIFNQSILLNTRFTESLLTNVIFDGAYFETVVFENTGLRHCSFIRVFGGKQFGSAGNVSILFKNCTLQDVDFEGADLDTVEFADSCELSSVSFKNAKLRYLNVRRSLDLRNVDFRNARVYGYREGSEYANIEDGNISSFFDKLGRERSPRRRPNRKSRARNHTRRKKPIRSRGKKSKSRSRRMPAYGNVPNGMSSRSTSRKMARIVESGARKARKDFEEGIHRFRNKSVYRSGAKYKAYKSGWDRYMNKKNGTSRRKSKRYHRKSQRRK